MLQLRPDLLPVMFEHAWATDKMSKPNLVINNNNEQARTPQAPPPPDRKKFCVRRSRMYTYTAHSRCTLLGLSHSIAAHSKRMRHARVIVDDNGREHAPLHLALGCAHARSLRSAAVEYTQCTLHRGSDASFVAQLLWVERIVRYARTRAQRRSPNFEDISKAELPPFVGSMRHDVTLRWC